MIAPMVNIHYARGKHIKALNAVRSNSTYTNGLVPLEQLQPTVRYSNMLWLP